MIGNGDMVRLPDGRIGRAKVDATLGLALVAIVSDDWEEACSVNLANLVELEKVS